MPKKIEPSKLMEWAGLDRIQTIVHSQLKHIFREISKDDLGIDGEIELLKEKENGGFETTGQFIKVQAKAGASYIGKEDKTTFEVKVSRADLEYWNSANLPVLFIIYNPKSRHHGKNNNKKPKNSPEIQILDPIGNNNPIKEMI